MKKTKHLKPDSAIFGFLLLAFSAQLMADPATCDAPKIAVQNMALLHELRPTIVWEKVPGANQYRVQVRSQLPEGAVVATIDTVVSANQFKPPQPLVESRATVSVKVSALCGQLESESSVKRFLLDVTRECPAPNAVQATAKEGRLMLVWDRQQAAEGYRVVLRSALNGAELERKEVADGKVSFDGGKYFNTLLMAAIESRCKQAVGDAVVLPINVSP